MGDVKARLMTRTVLSMTALRAGSSCTVQRSLEISLPEPRTCFHDFSSMVLTQIRGFFLWPDCVATPCTAIRLCLLLSEASLSVMPLFAQSLGDATTHSRYSRF